MEETTKEELLEFLQEEVGDHVQGVTYYDTENLEILYKSGFFQRYIEEETDVTREEMHEDLLLKTINIGLDSESYGADIYAQIVLTEVAIAYHLRLDEGEGVYISVSPDTNIRFPTFVYDCLDIVTE